jgi:RimJ/RimL family protein N-acetyltransferase
MDMAVIHTNNHSHGHAIAKAAGTVYNPAVDVSISRTEEDVLLGGVIYNSYTGASINIHMAGFTPRWASRDMLWICFDYPFNQLGCKKIFAQVPAQNAHAIKVNLKMGFKIETTIKDVFVDDDLVVLSMTRDNCRWLNIKPRNLVAKETA